MNPSLPPKKRESRQGSSEQRPPEEDFKFPAPFPTRRPYLQEGRDTELRADKELLPPPPPLPISSPLALPWHLPYYPALHAPYLTGHVRDRRGSGSPSWRDGQRAESLEASIPQTSSWLRSWPSVPVPTYKGHYALNSRDLWPYGSHARRDHTSSLFPPSSSSHLFSHPSIYHPHLLSEGRLRYSSRRPNGLDGHAGRPEPGAPTDAASDPPQRTENRDEPRRGASRGTLRDAHSISQSTDGDGRGLPKAQAHSSEPRRGKTPHEPSPGSASQSGAQIYYAMGSLYPSAQPKPSGPAPPAPAGNSQLNSHALDRERRSSPESYRPSVSVLGGPEAPPGAALPHFARGSLIELAGGRLKKVEEMRTEDFLHSADTSPEFHLSTCTVLLISAGPAQGFNHLQVLLTDRNTQELLTVLEEYPFFVRDRGWSSCSPRRSAQLYGLQCRQLSSGDVCLALTPTPTLLLSTTTSLTSTPTPAPSTPPSPRSTPTTLQPLSGTSARSGRTDGRLAPPTLPDWPRAKRKRRWSAPELQQRHTDLPQGCKRVKQQ